MRALVVPLLSCGVLFASSVFATSVEPCRQPLYLTFDTGHMGVAPLIDRGCVGETQGAGHFFRGK